MWVRGAYEYVHRREVSLLHRLFEVVEELTAANGAEVEGLAAPPHEGEDEVREEEEREGDGGGGEEEGVYVVVEKGYNPRHVNCHEEAVQSGAP